MDKWKFPSYCTYCDECLKRKAENYELQLIMIGIYLIVAYSLNLVKGYSGLLSLCHAAFYGIGAYVFTLVSMHWGLSFIPALLISIILTGIFAFLIGIPALRFRGDMFVVVTLGFQMIIFTILYNWVSLTRGPYGCLLYTSPSPRD